MYYIQIMLFCITFQPWLSLVIRVLGFVCVYDNSDRNVFLYLTLNFNMFSSEAELSVFFLDPVANFF
jgi:hypothetical protein